MASVKLGLQALECRRGSLPDVAEYPGELNKTRRLAEWERVVKVSCLNNCAYQMACAFNAYVTDGLALRKEQVGAYPAMNDPDLPDQNPRGCQKGPLAIDRIYDPSRLKYPLKRVGERGGGKWQRVSWDRALTEIADTLIDVLIHDGPDAVVFGGGTQGEIMSTEDLSCQVTCASLGIPMSNVTCDNGDEHQGAADTFGKTVFGDSADNWYYADMILVWGGNPAYTNIANYHYIAEARYNGTKVVTITPDHSPSAIHADLWVPVNIGADAALALSMAQVMIEERRYKDEFVREQTDLTLLVREDTRCFLREKDVRRGGREDVLYWFDEARGRIVEAPQKTLALNGMRPALEGEYEVTTLRGKVKVRPVFELLKQKLEEYTPEKASQVTGTSADLIRQLAREVASARGVVNVPTYNWGKFYHGDLIERAIILLFALCGHLGRKGASYSSFVILGVDAAVGATMQHGDRFLLAAAQTDPRFASFREQGYTDEAILYQYARDAFAKGAIVGTSFFHYIHSGLLELSQQHNSWDPYLKRPVEEYVNEALEKGWQVSTPKRGKDPKVMFNTGGNFLRRVRATQQILRTLLPKLKLLVVVDWRMSSTGLYADFVLPACHWYEKHALRTLQAAVYLHGVNKAMEPLHESKPEWELWCLLARKIQERAQERGITSYRDTAGNERRLDNLYAKVTFDGLYAPEDDEAVARDSFLNAANVEQMDWEEFKERGVAPFTSIGSDVRYIGNACDLELGEPLVPLTWHTEKKQPYPTYTRRIQFYIDQDLFLELGEELPVQKEDPKAGGDYPLRVTGGHARWSVHTIHIDSGLLLRLQRGEPVMFMSEADARARGVRDGDQVEVRNDVASFRIQAAVSPAVRPGQVMIYHAWENFQFEGWNHFKNAMPSPLNPIELAGNYFHVRAGTLANYPGFSDRETRVEVSKGSSGDAG